MVPPGMLAAIGESKAVAEMDAQLRGMSGIITRGGTLGRQRGKSFRLCQTAPISDSIFSTRCPRIITRGPPPIDFSHNGVAGARASDGQ